MVCNTGIVIRTAELANYFHLKAFSLNNAYVCDKEKINIVPRRS